MPEDPPAHPRPSARGRWFTRRDDGSVRSGPGPDPRDPQLLGAELRRLAAGHGWSTDLAAATLAARWEQVVGADLAAHCRPGRLHDGELLVVADSTAWATQVRLLSTKLLARLSEVVGAGVVTRLRVRGPTAPDWRHGSWRAGGGRGPRDTYG